MIALILCLSSGDKSFIAIVGLLALFLYMNNRKKDNP